MESSWVPESKLRPSWFSFWVYVLFLSSCHLLDWWVCVCLCVHAHVCPRIHTHLLVHIPSLFRLMCVKEVGLFTYESPNLFRLEYAPLQLVCWVHKNYHRAITCGWPPPKITGVWIALFSLIKFKDYARQILSPKIIFFYWFSKFSHWGESWAKLKLSYSQAQGFLLSGKRFLSLWELYCFLPLREAILRCKESYSKQIFQNSFYLTKALSLSPWCGTFKIFIGFPSF